MPIPIRTNEKTFSNKGLCIQDDKCKNQYFSAEDSWAVMGEAKKFESLGTTGPFVTYDEFTELSKCTKDPTNECLKKYNNLSSDEKLEMLGGKRRKTKRRGNRRRRTQRRARRRRHV